MDNNLAIDLVLVDRYDNFKGVAEKIEAHKKNLCHRAFSIILTNKEKTKVFLQKRQVSKYHCAGLWSNACCSHAIPNEKLIYTACNRLSFELNIATDLTYIGSVYYELQLDHNMFEHEFDHIFHGVFLEDMCDFNTNEVSECKWVDISDLIISIKYNPKKYTPWLPLILNEFLG
jgi:isopentenyl-diphosphate delta-isomerase